MKIIVLGSGVIGTTSAYYLAKAGHEVTVIDRQPAAGLETSFANAGEVSPGYAAPWAGPGVPHEGRQMADDAAQPPGAAPRARRRHVALDVPDAGQLQPEDATRSTRAAWCAWPNTAATAWCSCAPTPASPTMSAARAPCSCSAPRSSSTASAGDIAVLDQYEVPYKLLDPAGCERVEPALERRARTNSSAACSCPATRRATASSSPKAWPSMAEGLGVTLPPGRHHRALRHRAATR